MLNLAFAAMSTPAPCSLSATLTKTAAPSGGIVTSDTVTVNVPPGSTGSISFQSFSYGGTVTAEYNDNGGGWVPASEGGAFTSTQGESLAVRITSATAGESWTFTLKDDTRAVNIGTYTITAS